jgi:predicted aconitase with swiveling domain
MTTITGWRVTSGEAEGAVLKLDAPVSFWGGIGPEGDIIDVHHPQHGAIVTGRILVMRSGRGSSSGTYVLAELLRLGIAPAGIILTEPDGIIATGALVAAELYDARMPIVTVSDKDYARIEDRVTMSIAMDGDAALITINP